MQTHFFEEIRQILHGICPNARNVAKISRAALTKRIDFGLIQRKIVRLGMDYSDLKLRFHL